MNWAQLSQPEIVKYTDNGNHANDVVYLVLGPDRYAEYNRVGSTSNFYKGKNGATGVFTFSSGSPDKYALTDSNGNVFTFLGFNTTSGRGDGQLWTVENPNGDKAYVGDPSSASTATGTGAGTQGWDSGGRLMKAVDSAGRRFTYAGPAEANSSGCARPRPDHGHVVRRRRSTDRSG